MGKEVDKTEATRLLFYWKLTEENIKEGIYPSRNAIRNH